MQNFIKETAQGHATWWAQVLTQEERQDTRDAFRALLETAAVKRGQHESATENLRVVLDYLQTEKAENYKQKIESKRGPKSRKQEQLFHLINHLTKQKVSSAVPSSKTPSKIAM